MNEESLKLTIYFGERDRAGGRFLADALSKLHARHGLQTSLVMRGVEGFGIKHHLRTDRLLTLSEDLPLVSVAVDRRPRIEAALADLRALRFDGLVTLERARMLTGRIESAALELEPDDQAKLTVYVGRHERVGRRPAYELVVDTLRQGGVAGATVLLGVDGTAHGERQRARFFGANAQVPLMVIAVGEGRRIAELLPALGELVARPLMTLERVRVCKRDGETLASPHHLPESDASGLGVWQKLMVYAGEQASSHGGQLNHQVIRALRSAGASGATSLRGIWGYHGAHEPHGDSFWQLRRHVPVLTVIVDTPQRIRRWFELVDELTGTTGLVTSEMVPAFRATAPGLVRGGLEPARLEPIRPRADPDRALRPGHARLGQIVGEPLRGDAQSPEVRGSAEVQLIRGLLVARARLQVALNDDPAHQLLVLRVSERPLCRVEQELPDRLGPLIDGFSSSQRALRELVRNQEVA